MLNLRAEYTPKVYHHNPSTDEFGRWDDGLTRTVTIIAVFLTYPKQQPDLLAVTEDGKFVSDAIDRFTYTGSGWL